MWARRSTACASDLRCSSPRAATWRGRGPPPTRKTTHAAATTRTLNGYGNKEGLFKNDLAPIGEDFREGMTAIISVQVPEPQFESQTKIRLNNTEVEGIVASAVSEHLAKYLEENPKEAQK